MSTATDAGLARPMHPSRVVRSNMMSHHSVPAVASAPRNAMHDETQHRRGTVNGGLNWPNSEVRFNPCEPVVKGDCKSACCINIKPAYWAGYHDLALRTQFPSGCIPSTCCSKFLALVADCGSKFEGTQSLPFATAGALLTWKVLPWQSAANTSTSVASARLIGQRKMLGD